MPAGGRYLVSAVGILLLGLAALTLAFRGREDRFLITGSSTIAPILERAATRIEALHPELKIDVQTGGSSRGILDTKEGANDAGMSSRDLTVAEAEGLYVQPIAYDGIAVITHATNSIQGLSSEQVRQVFTKQIGDWEAIGGVGGPIRVINKAEGRATLHVFLEYFDLDNREIQADVVIGDNAQGVRLVAGDPQAIGYISVGEALTAIERGVPIKAIALDGVQPTLENVASGVYGMRRTLYLLLRIPVSGQGKKILDFLRGNPGGELIRELSFVPAGEVS